MSYEEEHAQLRSQVAEARRAIDQMQKELNKQIQLNDLHRFDRETYTKRIETELQSLTQALKEERSQVRVLQQQHRELTNQCACLKKEHSHEVQSLLRQFQEQQKQHKENEQRHAYNEKKLNEMLAEAQRTTSSEHAKTHARLSQKCNELEIRLKQVIELSKEEE